MYPLSLPERHVAQAEPRKHSGLGGFINRHRNDASGLSCRRTPYLFLAARHFELPLHHAVSQRVISPGKLCRCGKALAVRRCVLPRRLASRHAL